MNQNAVQHGEERRWATHFIAGWVQENHHLRCWHQHKTLSEAVACLDSVNGFVMAVTDGRERPLNYEEQGTLVRVLLTLYLGEREHSRKDHKTGALNEPAFREVLCDEIKRSRRHLRPLTIVYLDLDDFKPVNDLLGYPTGDLVLQIVARTMQKTVRQVDFVARLHGDEFALLLPETSYTDAGLVLDKVQRNLREAMRANQWPVTFSIGAVTFRIPPATATPDDMLNEAAKAMQLVKHTGKSRISQKKSD